MATIRTAIELEDRFSGVMDGIVNAVNMSVSVMERMQAVMNGPINTSALGGVRERADQAAGAVRELNDALQGVRQLTPASGQPQAAEIPVYRQSDSMDVFVNSGVERFEREVRSANNMLNTLSQARTHIVEAAAQACIFSPNAAADMNGMRDRLQAIRRQILTLENNSPDMGSDIANAELEQPEGAAREREMFNRAAESIDAGAADQAYFRLSQTVGDTERYIRDNVDKQGRFNHVIGDGVRHAVQLKSMIAGAVGAFVGADRIKNAFGFAEDSTSRLNAEARLIGVLADTLAADCVSRFELEAAADTVEAINEINSVQKVVDEVVVPVSAESGALADAFNQIAEKASEIGGRGVYGDDAVIAAGAEFAVCFGDTDAVEAMRDTLAFHAVGMSGGVEITPQVTVNYADNIGKLMSGSYDAMTRKGFELSDTRKLIIGGMAAQAGIVAALAEEYADMSLAKHKISELKGQYREFDNSVAAFDKGAAAFDTFRDSRSENAFDFGAAWGGEVVYDIGSMLDGFGFGNLPDIPSPEDNADVGIGSGVEDIAGGIGDIKDLLEITEEDLKYLRDIARQETVNRFTTAEITVEQTNHNTVSGKMDIDGLVEGLTDKMSEAMFIMAEGVHV